MTDLQEAYKIYYRETTMMPERRHLEALVERINELVRKLSDLDQNEDL